MDNHRRALDCIEGVEMDLEPKFSSLQYGMDSLDHALDCIVVEVKVLEQDSFLYQVECMGSLDRALGCKLGDQMVDQLASESF